ncbi:nuclear transport factor 2 family protein [Lentzea sp. NPDC058450]|uniref:nuclear transport factor 2 family protein n=1 Tax=Lentzea sp. NPDC058450 TaxID=3346505 RepID=UPI003666C48A
MTSRPSLLRRSAASSLALVVLTTIYFGPSMPTARASATRFKAIAVSLLRGVVERGDVSVVDRHVRPALVQHDPALPDGSQALKDLAVSLHRDHPRARLSVARVLAERDLVLVHSNVVLTPGTRGTAVADLFRFQDGKIAEHWNTVQDVPATTVSGHDMFSTLSSPRTTLPGPACATEASRNLTLGFFDEVLVGHDVAASDRYVSADTYYQHNPGFGDGREAFKTGTAEYFRQFPNAVTLPKRVIADGDLVAVHNNDKTDPAERGNAVVDIFRVRNGKIVEHWDVTQAVPETSANGNTMF